MIVQRVDFQDADAATKFQQSLHDIGFAVLVNHPLDTSLVRRIYADWYQFFSHTDKQAYTATASEAGDQSGFFPAYMAEQAVGSKAPDIKEYFHHFPNTPLPAELVSDINDYRGQVLKLGRELLAWLANFAPPAVRERLNDGQTWLSDQESLLRILHYPPISTGNESGAIRAAAHQDINMLTILPVAEQPGLQLQDKQGRWLNLDSENGALIINTGDMLAEVSEGWFPSTRHRVVNPDDDSNVSRVSLPFFLTPDLDVKLSTRYTAGRYLAERLDVLHQRQEDSN